MEERSRIMNAESFDRALMRISHEILERNAEETELCIVGVLRRGATLAAQITENLKKLSDITLYTGTLDITFYRDDLEKQARDPSLNHTDVQFEVEGKTVIIVDDVLYTGRTARAAMEGLLTGGRPKTIQLAALVDRGHRELPIRPDFVGKNIPTSKSEVIKVFVDEYDGECGVAIYTL